ncbi:hypothetical protein B0H14DRAFT_123249 [Mycena olivaceomarginata]|nr:hypothetical protein B0H14DRAFT_123249 [Mycena olivaceomarginata]
MMFGPVQCRYCLESAAHSTVRAQSAPPTLPPPSSTLPPPAHSRGRTLDNLALLLDEALEFLLSDGTIPVHASELRRLVYHSQARTFIKKKRGIELSDTTVNIYCYYLARPLAHHQGFDLKELNARIEADEDSAWVVEQVLVRESCCVAILLDSSDARIWCYAWKMLAALDFYRDDWEPPSLARIVELLGDADDDVRTGAIQILCRVGRSLDGARAVGSTDFLNYVPSLLDFATTRHHPPTDVRDAEQLGIPLHLAARRGAQNEAGPPRE